MIQSFTSHLTFGFWNRGFSNVLERRVVQLERGVVAIKNGLSEDEQITLSKIALLVGEKGFWRTDGKGDRVLNSTPYRGRIYKAVSSFPSNVGDLCARNIGIASETDEAIKIAQATHLICLYYKSLTEPPQEGFIPWHRDNGENDGEGEAPVVSFNIGDSCDFLVNHQRPKLDSSHSLANPANLAHRILFESGDILIFGGPCRHIWHSIYKIHTNTAPRFLPFQGARLNFTFRHTPKILGDEARFATVPANELPKDNQFYESSKMNLTGPHPAKSSDNS